MLWGDRSIYWFLVLSLSEMEWDGCLYLWMNLIIYVSMSLCFCRVHIQIHYVVISVKQSEIPAKQPSSLQQLTAERPRASSAAAVCVSSARALRAVLRLRSPDSREPETQHVCHVICAPCAACSCQVNRQKVRAPVPLSSLLLLCLFSLFFHMCLARGSRKLADERKWSVAVLAC